VADHGTRASIIRRLRKGLATSIPHDSADRPHVANIISRCLRYPGGLAELLEAARLYADPDEPAFAEAYAAAGRLAAETGQEWPA
jgi:Effector-associated domain 2